MTSPLPLQPGAQLEHIATGTSFGDGPLYIPGEHAVRWSDVTSNRILSLDLTTGETTVWQAGVGHASGRAHHPDLGIVQCSHGNRAIEKAPLVPFMQAEMLLDFYEGGQLNGPHDLAVHPIDSTVWFTDPMIGLDTPGHGPGGESGYGRSYVFRLDHHGDLEPVVTELSRPTGIAFSPDARHLYVANSAEAVGTGKGADASPLPRASIMDEAGRRHVWVFDVTAESTIAKGSGRVLGAPDSGIPGGLAVDVEGRVWIAGADDSAGTGSVTVVSPDGAVLGSVEVPEPASNLTFGGADGSDLLVTGRTGLYRLRTETRAAS